MLSLWEAVARGASPFVLFHWKLLVISPVLMRIRGGVSQAFHGCFQDNVHCRVSGETMVAQDGPVWFNTSDLFRIL